MKKIEFVDEIKFKQMIVAYQSNPEKYGKLLGELFIEIVGVVFKIFSDDLPLVKKISKRKLIFDCFNNLVKYNAKKGKAFNYFATIVINQLRKNYRTLKKEKELEEKYKDFIDIN